MREAAAEGSGWATAEDVIRRLFGLAGGNGENEENEE